MTKILIIGLFIVLVGSYFLYTSMYTVQGVIKSTMRVENKTLIKSQQALHQIKYNPVGL